MRGCISISSKPLLPALVLAALLTAVSVPTTHAAAPDEKESKEKTFAPEEDDFAQTPFTEYGEFNEEADEAADTKFFQLGRFFGVSLGAGFQGITGNRGLLWQGGFPLINLGIHYWFDFHVALDMGGYYVSHFYDSTTAGERFNVSMFVFGLGVKYYFDTKNLSAPISFANPFLRVGFGSYNKTEASTTDGGTPTQDSSIGFNLGGGLEFAIKPRKVYFTAEGQVHFMSFTDTFTTRFRNKGVADLSGAFYTVTTNVLFTW